jgi:hypothetical protein
MTRRSSGSTYHDAAWIFALWRALHGEISIEDIAADVIAGLSPYLPANEDSFLSPELLPQTSAFFHSADSLREDAVAQTEVPQPTESLCSEPDSREFSIHHYYFKFKEHCYCLELPAPAHSPTAA